jgi:capsular polysaccharide biosynthesis protein
MEEIDIKDFLKYLKKFIIPAAAALVLAVAGVLIYEINYKTTLYKATTKVVLAQAVVNDEKSKKVEETGITLNDININQKLVQTYSEIAKSDEVLQKSIDKLGLETTPADLSKRVSVTDVTDTVIIKISVEDEDPEKSAEISNRIAKEFTRSVKDTFGLSNAAILDPAKTPAAPSNDTLARDVVIAAFIAVFGIIAIAFIIYYFDNFWVIYSIDIKSFKKIIFFCPFFICFC